MRVVAIILITFFSQSLVGQVKVDSLGFETFEMTTDGETYVMKKYYMVILKRGSTTNQPAEDARKIQAGHMEHINWMNAEGYLQIAGPFGDDSDYRGIFILSVPTMEKAQELVNKDPAVKAGRLIGEIHPWWGGVGSSLK